MRLGISSARHTHTHIHTGTLLTALHHTPNSSAYLPICVKSSGLGPNRTSKHHTLTPHSSHGFPHTHTNTLTHCSHGFPHTHKHSHTLTHSLANTQTE